MYTLMLTDMKSIFDDRDYLTYSDLILKKKIQFGWLYQRLKSMLFEFFNHCLFDELRLENKFWNFLQMFVKIFALFLLIIYNITV